MSHVKCAVCSVDPPSGIPHALCVQCMSVQYCSKKCQVADWKYHEQVCKQFAEFIARTPRPSALHRLVLLFPVCKDKPEVVWARCTEYPIRACLEGLVGSRVELALLTGNLPDKFLKLKFLDHSLMIGYRDCFQFDGSQPNISIDKFMSGKQRQFWRGPIAVVSSTIREDGDEDGEDQDVTLSDLPLLVEYFAQIGSWQLKISEGEIWQKKIFRRHPEATAKFQVVEISCHGHMRFLGSQKYRIETVAKDGPIFDLQLLGIPMMVCNKRTEWLGREDMGFDPDSNHEGAILSFDVDPTSDRFGEVIDKNWDIALGSVMIARQDQKPITPKQVESLVEFLLSKILPAFCTFDIAATLGDLADGALTMAREAFVKKNICKARFLDFFQEFKQRKIGEGRKPGPPLYPSMGSESLVSKLH